MPAAGTQLQCATVPVGGSATYQIWFRLPVPNPNHILTVKVTIMWVGVIGWARLIGLWLVKMSHVNLFLISGLTMHNSVGLGLEHQVLVLVSVLKKKSCSFQDFCCNSWRQWARHTMAFSEYMSQSCNKLMREANSYTYMERLDKLNLWTVERRNRSDLIKVFKMAKNLSPIPLTKFFELNTDNRTRGHSFTLVKHRCNCEVCRLSLLHRKSC